jgi:hypothetical protein
MKNPIQNLRFLNNDYELNDKWIAVFTHFILLDKHNKMPLIAWYKELKTLIDDLGHDEFVGKGISWIKDCIAKSKKARQRSHQRVGMPAAHWAIEDGLRDQTPTPEWVKKVYGQDLNSGSFFQMQRFVYLNNFQNYFYQSLGGRILRGFLHATVVLPDEKLVQLLDEFAKTNPNHAQDAIFIYTKMDKDFSVPRLVYLKGRAKNKNVQKRIATAIKEIGKKHGLSSVEIEESIVPTYNMNLDGQHIEQMGDFQAVFNCQNYKTFETYYLTPDGKKQKSVPVQVKTQFAEELKSFKKDCKEIKTNISAQRKRIESFYHFDRVIPYNNWKKYYLDHPLVRIIAKDLIWNFQDEQQNVNGILHEGQMVQVDGSPIEDLSDATQVRLWHPIGFDATDVLSWRQLIINEQRTQAFKQAFREVYLLTDAEITTNTYSNRFASHILNKDHLYALCKERGWSTSGMFDMGYVRLNVPNTDYMAEFWVGDVYLGEHSRMYGSAHVSTDQVRFYKKKVQIELIEVPAPIFSEVMRDVDLFVGVTSIGNDPNWQDRGDRNTQNYWASYSFGNLSETAKTRSEILKNIIPKMKIAKQCSFEGKYLIVEGQLRTYKIHMGSGNILMEPNDQYLCIVPDRKPSGLKKVFIPFEGDNMLSIIISKAMLLAADTKIDDPTIVRQINT